MHSFCAAPEAHGCEGPDFSRAVRGAIIDRALAPEGVLRMDKMIFLNIGWMSRYAGVRGDPISGGQKYLARHGYGHEMLNFKPYAGKMYGTAPVPHGTIRLEKLGAPKGADSEDRVLVVWVARSLIVGWYKNATVYRHSQLPPKSSGHSYKGKPISYYVTAAASDCKIVLPADSRLFPVPRAGKRKQAMGRYTWFAEGTVNRRFRADVLKYVASEGNILVLGRKKRAQKLGATPYQADPQKRTEIERIAIGRVTEHFKSQHYKVSSHESDNLGWDLSAILPEMGIELKLEVKGLSGPDIAVELTPNEYTMMKKHKHDYRICVVTSCLEKKKLAIFAYDEMRRLWVDETDRPLQIKEMKAARLRLLPSKDWQEHGSLRFPAAPRA